MKIFIVYFDPPETLHPFEWSKIEKVFSTKEKAENWINSYVRPKTYKNYYDIQEFEIE